MSTAEQRAIAESDSLLIELRKAMNAALSPILTSACRNGSSGEVVISAAAAAARDLIGSMAAQLGKPGHEMAIVDRVLGIMRSELATQDWAALRALLRSADREAVPARVLS